MPKERIMRGLLVIVLTAGAAWGQLLNRPESIVFDAARNRYLLSNYGNGYLVQIDSSGAQSYFINTQRTGIQGLEILGDTVYIGARSSIMGFDLNSGAPVMDVAIPGVSNLNDVAVDSSGNVYASDVLGGAIYKIQLSDRTWSAFARSSISYPNGIYYDHPNLRLLVCSFRTNSPIQAIDLADSSVSTVVATNLSDCDGLTQDTFGNFYVSSWATTSIYKFDNAFSRPPERIYTHGGGPADIACNRRDNKLAVPLMNSNQAVFLDCTRFGVEGGAPAVYHAQGLELSPCSPNPCRRRCRLEYAIPRRLPVRLSVFDPLGRKVITTLDRMQEAGRNVAELDLSELPPGVYFCRLVAGSEGQTVKMLRID
jgi:sugar lactone lactonase YvrE